MKQECNKNQHDYKLILVEKNVNPRGDNMKTYECKKCGRQTWKFN